MKDRQRLQKIIPILVMTALLYALLTAVHTTERTGPVNGALDRSLATLMVGMRPLNAATPNGAWAYVRGTATFVKTITEAINAMIQAINASGLTSLASYQGNTGTYKIDWNRNASVSFTRGNDGALLGNATYTKSLRVFNQSNQLILEMYFNADANGGLLVRWMPERTNPGLYPTNGGVGECQVSGNEGSRTMICSFSGGPFNTLSAPHNWKETIIKAQEIDDEIRISSLSRTNQNATWDPDGAGPCADAHYYFPLAYIVKNVSPYYTTAKFGFNDNAVSANVCGFASPFNYGLFNTAENPNATDGTQYFYGENIAAGAIPAAYPTAAAVDALFGTITNTGAGDGKVDKVVLDNLALAFKNPASPF